MTLADDTAVWAARANRAGVLWLGPALQHALMPTLGATPHFLADEEGDDGVVWQEFARGPFRLGYVGFPIGGTLQGLAVGKARIARLLGSAPGRRLHVLRVIGAAFNPSEGLTTRAQQFLPETKILDLQQFDPLCIGHIRRDITRAKQLGVVVSPVESTDHAKAIYGAYAQMVTSHGGAPKYSQSYFSELVQISMREHRMRVYLATVENRFAGFLVAVLERDVGYYLHSAVLPEFRKCSVTDLLLLTALQTARAAGLKAFNSMASPPSQPGLVRFKEKWGGVTQQQTVYELRLSPLIAAVMRAGATMQRFLPRANND